MEHLANMKALTVPMLKTLAVPARNYMKRLHERAVEEKQNRKDRGARRRKQKLDQKKASTEAEDGKHKAALLLSVESTSRAEREAGCRSWEARVRGSLQEEQCTVFDATRWWYSWYSWCSWYSLCTFPTIA